MRILNKIITVCFIIALTVTLTITPTLADNLSNTYNTDIDPYFNGAVIEGIYKDTSNAEWNNKKYVLSMNTANKYVPGTGILSFDDAFRLTNLENGQYKNMAFTHRYSIANDGTGRPITHYYIQKTDSQLEALYSNGFSITLYNIDLKQKDFVENFDNLRGVSPYIVFYFKNNVNPTFNVKYDITYEHITVNEDITYETRKITKWGDNTSQSEPVATSLLYGGNLIENVTDASGNRALDIVRIKSIKTTFEFLKAPDFEELQYRSQAQNSPNVSLIKATSNQYQQIVPNSAHTFADFTSWIGNTTSGFLNTEIYPGLKFWYVLMIPISLGLLMGFLRLFSGG